VVHGWTFASALFHRTDNFGNVERKTAKWNTDHVAFVYGGSASAREFKNKASVGHRTVHPTPVVLLSAGLRQHDDSAHARDSATANIRSVFTLDPLKTLAITNG
jgi:hypothetical protein